MGNQLTSPPSGASANSRPQGKSFLRNIPISRLLFLVLAIFCLVGMFAFLIDLLQLGQEPIVVVLIWTLFTGAMGVLYYILITRAPRLLVLGIATHIVGSRAINRWIGHFAAELIHPSINYGLRVAVISSMILSIAACLFFLIFIQREGKRAVQMQTELTLAQGIQHTLVPILDIAGEGYEMYGRTIPSDQVGGDLVDAVALPDGSIVACVADIAGHGLGAGILMGMVKTAIRTQLFDDEPALSSIFDRLNRVLPAVKEPHMYATCAAIHVGQRDSSGTRSVQYALAGHPAILHLSGESVAHLTDRQFPLGLLPCESYQSHRLTVHPGDMLLISTDGIVETENSAGEDFGFPRTEKFLLSNSGHPLYQIADSLFGAVKSFGPQLDDRTLLLVRFS
jgi:Stage II sporulation protein E (SpoIIE)